MGAQNSENNSVFSNSNWNIPNTLTIARILLGVVMFAFLEFHCYLAGMVLFIIAACTDWVDGWWARKYNQCTVLGRIMDPFADKLIVCGAFIYLASIPELLEDIKCWGLGVWVVVVMISREMLITTIRAFLEQQGRDFSAKWAGKWKMGLQCVAVPACLLWVIMSSRPDWLYYLMVLSLWGTIILTLYSGAIYVVVAMRPQEKP